MTTKQTDKQPWKYWWVVPLTIVTLCVVALVWLFYNGFKNQEYKDEIAGVYFNEYEDMNGGEYYILNKNGEGLRYIDYVDEGESMRGITNLKWLTSYKEKIAWITTYDRNNEPIYQFAVKVCDGYLVDEDGFKYIKTDMPTSDLLISREQ